METPSFLILRPSALESSLISLASYSLQFSISKSQGFYSQPMARGLALLTINSAAFWILGTQISCPDYYNSFLTGPLVLNSSGPTYAQHSSESDFFLDTSVLLFFSKPSKAFHFLWPKRASLIRSHLFLSLASL